MEEKEESTVNPPYSLGRTDRSTSLWVDNGDKMILKAYKTALKSTMTAALHLLIGLGARCHEEKHTETISNLKNMVQSQEIILGRYLKLYGKLPARTKKES